jgi:nicotinamidase-related amidase
MSKDTIRKWLNVRKTMAPELNLDKLALLIIDMQEYQVRKDWSAYKLANALVTNMLDYFMEQTAAVVEPNIKKLVDLFRENNLTIIYTMFSSFQKDGSDLIPAIRNLNLMGEQQFGDAVFPHKDHSGSKIIDALKPKETDFIVVKNSSSVFVSTKLEFHLRNMGIEQLFVTGVVTNICVEGAARTASDLGFDVFIIDDACAAWSPEIHENTLQSFSLFFGYVITTEEAEALLREKFVKR